MTRAAVTTPTTEPGEVTPCELGARVLRLEGGRVSIERLAHCIRQTWPQVGVQGGFDAADCALRELHCEPVGRPARGADPRTVRWRPAKTKGQVIA